MRNAVPTVSRPRIICVEDDDSLRLLLTEFLSSEGFEVLAFGSPAEALEHIRGWSDHVDLLVTDFYLPGMTGPELATFATGLLPKLPVVLLSASDERPPLPAGHVFLSKSAPLSTLRSIINGLLSRC